ncbi:MAG: SDR family NAD(P)-dependent oxidoreductase, partial [Micromonosporaceae bacterium]
ADVARRLREAGAPVAVAAPGVAFEAADDGTYTLRPGEAEDYSRLFRELAGHSPGRLRLVHGWMVGESPAGDEVARARHWLDHGFFSCLTALQTASAATRGTPLELAILTSDMQDVAGDGRVEPAKSAVLGLVNTAPQEFEDLACYSVDIGPGSSGGQLFAELTAGPRRGQVAYRGRKRWTWSFIGAHLETGEGVRELLREGGTYLITGGLGGLGLALARQLAEEIAPRLVLTGRTGLPDRSEWSALVERGSVEDPVVRRIQALLAVEDAGARVMVCAGDVTDEARMRELRTEVEAEFGEIDGIFHLAGVAGGGMLETRPREAAEAVLLPKVVGSYVLDRVFVPRLLVLYSSIVAVAGYFGIGDYNGANAVLDAFAQSRWDSGRHVVSINWPLWSEVGMGADSNAPAILGDLARGQATTAVAHPLLAGRHEGSEDAASFEIELSHEVWVLAEHKIKQVPTMPGTGVVELVRAAYQEVSGEPQAELRNLTFPRPLVSAPGVAARLEMTRRDDGGYDVSLVGGAAGEPPQEYARGQVHPVNGDRPDKHDLQALRAACTEARSVDIPLEWLAPPDSLITFGARWDNIEALASAEDQRSMSTIALAEELRSDVEQFFLHPAMLDSAVSLIQGYRVEGAYLPIGYDRVVARAPLPARFHGILRPLDDGRGEVVRADLSLVDDDGVELVLVEGYAMTRVDPKTGFAAASGPGAGSGATQAPARAGSRTSMGMLWSTDDDEGGINNDEGAEILRQVLGSGIRPQVICAPEGLGERLRSSARVTRAALMEKLSAASRGGSGTGTRNVATPYVEPEPGIERTIADLWQDSLGVDKVGADDEFIDLGGDSLMAVQVGDRLNRRFRVEVSIAALIEARTVRNLAKVVEEALMKRVSSLSEEEALRELSELEQTD